MNCFLQGKLSQLSSTSISFKSWPTQFEKNGRDTKADHQTGNQEKTREDAVVVEHLVAEIHVITWILADKPMGAKARVRWR